MIKEMPESNHTVERRRFERVDISHEAQVLVLDARGRKVGVLRQLARGGFMMEPEKDYRQENKVHNFTIHDPRQGLSVMVTARPRSAGRDYAGFEFVDLAPAAAVDIGMIIGTYYEHGKE